MDFGLTTFTLAAAAGALSTLSPCVLPLVPIIVGSAGAAHRYGPLALAGGLTLSFAVLGTFLAYAGTAVGLSPDVVRIIGAVLVGAFGIILLSGPLQRRFAAATSGFGARGDALLSRVELSGLQGQLLVGLVLGLVWAPCVGPTLGAAIGLASQGRDLGPITLVMATFGLGASVPLLLVGWASRRALGPNRASLMRAGSVGKIVLGAAFVLVSVAILTGFDKVVESWMVEHSPDWLTDLTTKY
jgi:cytochrome c-type biogenesis protein